MKTILVIILSSFVLGKAYAVYERISVDSKINGKPVRLIFDTADDSSVILYSTTTERLGLKVKNPDRSYFKSPKIIWTMSETCDFELGTIKTKFPFLPVIQNDFHWTEDGIVGWPIVHEYFSQYSLLLDLAANKMEWLTNLPTGLDTWTKFPLQTNFAILAFKVSYQTNTNCVVIIDTGAPNGITLNLQKLQEIKVVQTKPGTTFHAYDIGYSGDVMISQQAWADKISIGSIELNDVPLEGASPVELALGSSSNTQYVATLGLAALKRLEIIVDNPHGLIYLRPKKNPPMPYEHNRLGAVFVPRDLRSTNLIATVADGSPAYEAGIRNRDILLKINGRDTISELTESPNFEQPAGTKIEFTLKRDDKIFKTTATLRNILPPDAPKNSN